LSLEQPGQGFARSADISWVTAVATQLLRFRYGVLTVWAGLWFQLDWGRRLGDWAINEFGSRVLLHASAAYSGGPGGALHLYANDPKIQMGPPALVLGMPFQLVQPWFGKFLAALVMTSLGVACIRLLEAAVPNRDVRGVALLGGLVAMPAWASVAVLFMHLDDVIALVGFCVALAAIPRTRQWWLAAVMLGIGAAAKPWAIVGLAMLFALPRARRAPAALIAIGSAALCWAPFVVGAPGTFSALGSVQIPNDASSALRALGVAASFGPTWVRPVQFLLGIAVAFVGVRSGRVAGGLLAGLAVRVMFDPGAWSYYGAGPVMAALAIDVTSESPTRRFAPWTTGVLLVEYVLPLAVPQPSVVGALRLAACLATVVWMCRPVNSRATAPVMAPVPSAS
jgi:hypothetical protein